MKTTAYCYGFLLIGICPLALWFVSVPSASSVSSETHVNESHNSPLSVTTIACPPPFKETPGGECVITRDAMLSQTIVLPSGTKFNCRSHKLTPQTKGTAVARSKPEVALLLNDVRNVHIRNCDIEGFDFGIFAMKSKAETGPSGNSAAPLNRIFGNTINARFIAITLLAMDKTEIKNNHLIFGAKGGRGVYVGRDSDRNEIVNNTIEGNFDPALTQTPRAPGPVLPSNSPLVPEGSAIMITQTEGPESTLMTAVIDGVIYQVNIADSSEPTTSFTEDNLVEGNTIRLPASTPVDGIALAAPERTIVKGNTLVGTKLAIRAGMQAGTGVEKQFAGHCSGNSSRLCVANGDCKITGFPDAGTCALPPKKSVSWFGSNNVIEGNTIKSLFTNGITIAAANAKVIGNTLVGPARSGGLGGINLIGKLPIDTAVISGNSVSDVETAVSFTFVFSGLSSTTFGARISGNDFTRYTRAVQTSNDYGLTSELSVAGKGNYWGIPCPGFDPSKVVKMNGTVNPAVKDSRPFGVPIASGAGSATAPCP